jgi:hypothetical protein
VAYDEGTAQRIREALDDRLDVAEAGFETDGDLCAWIERGVAFAASLPPK